MYRTRPGILRIFGCAAVFILFSGLVAIPLRALCSSATDSLLDPEKAVLLKEGDKGETVKALQRVLEALGYSAGPADGIFGSQTRSAVVRFQKDSGLLADGIAGPSTLSSLSGSYDRQYPPETHAVRRGETLWDIGQRYGVPVANLMAANHIKDANLIYAGQLLAIRQAAGKGGPEGPGPDHDPVLEVPPEPSFPEPVQGICLTFNDGPDTGTTETILAILEKYGLKATFFVIGKKAASNPDLVRQIASAGHIIGVHGYDHKLLAGLSAREVASDMQKAADIIQQITGTRPWLYRPPGGALDETQIREAAKLGLQVMMWTNIGGADLGASSPQEVIDRVLVSARHGGIVLLHEGLQYTVEALPLLVESLARQRFGFRNPVR